MQRCEYRDDCLPERFPGGGVTVCPLEESDAVEMCRHHKLNAENARMQGRCVWTHITDYDQDYWETACGQAWEFTDGGPQENGLKFCGYCGCRLQVGGTDGRADKTWHGDDGPEM